MENQKTKLGAVRQLAIIAILLVLLGIFISACRNSENAIPSLANTMGPTPTPKSTKPLTTTSSTSTATVTSSPPTSSATPTVTPSQTQLLTMTPLSEPGMIALLDGGTSSKGWSGKLAFDADGQTIALAGKTIRFWGVNTHQLISEWENPYWESCSVADAGFSPNGHYFAVSISHCHGAPDAVGHLLIWDVELGELLHDWSQVDASMLDLDQAPYNIPVYGFQFFADTSQIAFPNGNNVEIRQIVDGKSLAKLSLGDDMYASEISLSIDGNFLNILMQWDKLNDFPANYKTKFAVEIWDLETQTIDRKIDYPDEIAFPNEHMTLIGKLLNHVNVVAGQNQLINLETDEIDEIPYRNGWKIYNSDGSLMLVVRYFGFEPGEQHMELWNTDNWRNIYTFEPFSKADWYYGPTDFIFTPDSTMLAVMYEGQVALWNIRQVVEP